MSNLFTVLGRYALLVDEVAKRAEKAETTSKAWYDAWCELWVDRNNARDEARYWYAKYQKLTEGVMVIEMNFVPPDAIDN